MVDSARQLGNSSGGSGHALSQKALKLGSWKIRLHGLAEPISTEIFFEKLIGCFSRHQRNLYDRPEFVLCRLQRYRSGIEMVVKGQTETEAASFNTPNGNFRLA